MTYQCLEENGHSHDLYMVPFEGGIVDFSCETAFTTQQPQYFLQVVLR